MNTVIRLLKKKQKHGKRWKKYILYNFKYFIDGTVQLHTDDVVNKSVVFRITETSYYSGLKMKRRFLIKKKSHRSCSVKKIK